MREDMSKVLVEKPRHGSDNGGISSRHARRSIKHELRIANDYEDAHFDQRVSMKGHLHEHRWDEKELNENLNPLRRFLRSNVGRLWDDVYSEIMAGINMNNAVQFHVWQHLIQFGEVETKTYMRGNTVIVNDKMPHRIGSSYREEFYVHPLDGTLRFAPRENRYRNPHAKIQRSLDEDRYIDFKKPLTQYHRINGVWYAIAMRKATDDEIQHKSFGKMVRRVRTITPPEYGLILNLEDDEAYYQTGVTKQGKYEIYYKFEQNYGNSKVYDQLIEAHQGDRLGIYGHYSTSRVWLICKELFGGPYFPINKQQIGKREVKRIEAAMAVRDKKRIAA
jgi:hypothetical protein